MSNNKLKVLKSEMYKSLSEMRKEEDKIPKGKNKKSDWVNFEKAKAKYLAAKQRVMGEEKRLGYYDY